MMNAPGGIAKSFIGLNPGRTVYPKSLPEPINSLKNARITIATKYPNPFENPSTIDGKIVFFDAKLSALAKIKQLTTIKGINRPSDA